MIDDEREKILSTFRNVTDPVMIGKVYNFYQEGFEEYALKTPNATALIAVDGTFTYRQFDEAAKNFPRYSWKNCGK